MNKSQRFALAFAIITLGMGAACLVFGDYLLASVNAVALLANVWVLAIEQRLKRRYACTVCHGKNYVTARRADGRTAVERCDNCSPFLSDEQAAVLARRDGVACREAWPYEVSA